MSATFLERDLSVQCFIPQAFCFNIPTFCVVASLPKQMVKSNAKADAKSVKKFHLKNKAVKDDDTPEGNYKKDFSGDAKAVIEYTKKILSTPATSSTPSSSSFEAFLQELSLDELQKVEEYMLKDKAVLAVKMSSLCYRTKEVQQVKDLRDYLNYVLSKADDIAHDMVVSACSTEKGFHKETLEKHLAVAVAVKKVKNSKMSD